MIFAVIIFIIREGLILQIQQSEEFSLLFVG